MNRVRAFCRLGHVTVCRNEVVVSCSRSVLNGVFPLFNLRVCALQLVVNKLCICKVLLASILRGLILLQSVIWATSGQFRRLRVVAAAVAVVTSWNG